MPPIVWRQINSVSLVVRGDDHAATIQDAVLAEILLIDAQNIGRRGGVGLHVVIEGESVDIAQVARLADAQDH